MNLFRSSSKNFVKSSTSGNSSSSYFRNSTWCSSKTPSRSSSSNHSKRIISKVSRKITPIVTQEIFSEVPFQEIPSEAPKVIHLGISFDILHGIHGGNLFKIFQIITSGLSYESWKYPSGEVSSELLRKVLFKYYFLGVHRKIPLKVPRDIHLGIPNFWTSSRKKKNILMDFLDEFSNKYLEKFQRRWKTSQENCRRNFQFN